MTLFVGWRLRRTVGVGAAKPRLLRFRLSHWFSPAPAAACGPTCRPRRGGRRCRPRPSARPSPATGRRARPARPDPPARDRNPPRSAPAGATPREDGLGELVDLCRRRLATREHPEVDADFERRPLALPHESQDVFELHIWLVTRLGPSLTFCRLPAESPCCNKRPGQAPSRDDRDRPGLVP